jgi:serine/threonine protein kinase
MSAFGVIVHGPTPQVKDFNPLAPDQLERVVRRCLAKDPDKRYQSIKDVAIELEELEQEMHSIPGSADSASSSLSWRASSEGSLSATSQRVTRSQQSGVGVSTITQTSSGEALLVEIKRHKTFAFLLLGGFIVSVVGLAFLLSRISGGRDANSQAPARTAVARPEMKVARLTSK